MQPAAALLIRSSLADAGRWTATPRTPRRRRLVPAYLSTDPDFDPRTFGLDWDAFRDLDPAPESDMDTDRAVGPVPLRPWTGRRAPGNQAVPCTVLDADDELEAQRLDRTTAPPAAVVRTQQLTPRINQIVAPGDPPMVPWDAERTRLIVQVASPSIIPIYITAGPQVPSVGFPTPALGQPIDPGTSWESPTPWALHRAVATSPILRFVRVIEVFR